VDDYLKQFLEVALDPEVGQRKGQKLMNSLYISCPSLYFRIEEERPDLNPFYRDEDLWETVKWITENWGKTR